MNTSPPGAQKYLEELPSIGDGIWKNDNFWKREGIDVSSTKDKKRGGIPFGQPVDTLTEDQESMMRKVFNTISCQNFPHVKKEQIDDADVAKFCVNRMTKSGKDENENLDKLPSMEMCTEAIDEAILIVHEPDNQCTFEAFKGAICAKRTTANPYGSLLAKILEQVLSVDDEFTATEDEVGEMSIGQQLFEYHKFMGNVQQSCRDEEGKEAAFANKITLTRNVAEAYLNNIVEEAQQLVRRRDHYQQRLRDLDPSLRQRSQHRAVDDIFDSELIPGARWVG